MSNDKIDEFSFMLFRTVRIREVPKTYHEDFAQLLARKCGEVEQWKSTAKELMVAFRNQSSVASALALDGMKYIDHKVIIWKASTETPAAVLAIEGPKKASEEEEDKAMRKKITEELSRMNDDYKRRREQAAEDGTYALEHGRQQAVKEGMSKEERDAFLREHAVRQAKALVALGTHCTAMQQKELDTLKDQLEKLRKTNDECSAQLAAE